MQAARKATDESGSVNEVLRAKEQQIAELFSEGDRLSKQAWQAYSVLHKGWCSTSTRYLHKRW